MRYLRGFPFFSCLSCTNNPGAWDKFKVVLTSFIPGSVLPHA